MLVASNHVLFAMLDQNGYAVSRGLSVSSVALVCGGIAQGEGYTLPRIRLTARVPTVFPSVEIYISGDRTRASLAGRVQGREGIGVEDIVSSPEDRLAIRKRRPGKVKPR